jgi:hypoxanthine phosphoribosyltransferase
MKKVYVNWSDVERQTQEIIRQMYLDEFHPDYVVGITRGGLIPANLISQYLEVPMHTLKVSLRDDDQCETNAWMAEDAFAGKKILIVDDINDSGATLNWIRQDWQGSNLPNDTAWAQIWGGNVRVAVLYDNQSSHNEIEVTYSAEQVNKFETPQWIVFPWEEWWRKWNPDEQHI